MEVFYTAKIDKRVYLSYRDKFDVIDIRLANWFDSKEKLLDKLEIIGGEFDKLEIVEIKINSQNVLLKKNRKDK